MAYDAAKDVEHDHSNFARRPRMRRSKNRQEAERSRGRAAAAAKIGDRHTETASNQDAERSTFEARRWAERATGREGRLFAARSV